MVDLMSLEKQVDKDFIVARRRAWMRGLGAMLRGRRGTIGLQSFQEALRPSGAGSGVPRGRNTVEVARIVGSDDKSG